MIYGIIIGLVIGFGAGYFVAVKGKGDAKEKIVYMTEDAARKEGNINKVLEYIKDKEKFTNDDLEKLLGVSDTTIGRYLDELEAAGTITQHGTTGQGVYYTKTP